MEILPEGEPTMVLSPSLVNDGDECEDTIADGKHWALTKKRRGRGGQ